MSSSADNERNTNYLESLESASATAKNQLQRIKAKRGGSISEETINGVLDEIFDPILDEYSDLDAETLYPELTKITLLIRNAFLGEAASGNPSIVVESPVNNLTENQVLSSLKKQWMEIRNEFTRIKLAIESDLSERANLKEAAQKLETAVIVFLKNYDETYKNLLQQENESLLNNIVFSQARPEVSGFLIEIKKWIKFLNSDKDQLWMIELDELWTSINIKYNERTTGEVLKDETERMRNTLPDSLSPEERNFFEEALRIRDFALLETGSEGVSRHMCWQDAKGVRDKAASYNISTTGVRERIIEANFLGLKMQEVFSYLRETVFGFHPEKDRFVRDASFKKIQKWNASHGLSEQKTFKPHNYAKLGNPDASTAGWIPNVSEILIEKFPKLKSLPDFILDTIIFSIIVTEMRMEGFYPLYDAYIASPITGVDVEAIFPWGAVGFLDYKAGGYGAIPGYLGLLASMKWPSCTDLSIPPSRIIDRAGNDKGKPYSYEEMAQIAREGDWLTFGKENETFARLTPFQDMDHEKGPNWRNEEGMMVLDYGSDATRRGKALENRAKAVIVRNFIRTMLSPSAGYDIVDIKPDMKILPSPYDAFIGSFRGKKFEISLADLANIYKVFDEFIKRVGDGPGQTFDSVEAIMKDLGEVVGLIAKFKQMNKLGESDREIYNDFLKLTNILFSIYIRKLFVNFASLPDEKKTAFYQNESSVLIKRNIFDTKFSQIKQSLQSDRALFLRRAIDLIKASTTLPMAIQLYFTASTKEEISATEGWNDKGILIQAMENSVSRWGRFFSPISEEYMANSWKMFTTFRVQFPEIAAFVEKWIHPSDNTKDKKE